MNLKNLNTKFLGRENYFYNSIDSTQKEIWRLYDKNYQSGVLVSTGIQTDGIGTHGRVWYTEQVNNIAFSFLIRPNCNITYLDGLTKEIAVIIVDIFKNKYGIELGIKEPNDIVYKNKKLGGILIQTKTEKEVVKALVIGIGINTSQVDFNADIKNIATSIKKEFDIEINVEDFIETFCNIFETKLLERID